MTRPIIAALLTLIVLTASAAAALATPVEKREYFEGDPADLPCAIRIEFARSTRGPDYDTWDAMRSYIADSLDIQRAEAFGWRTDGEFILCLRVEETAAIGKVFGDLSKLTPKSPAPDVGPTTIALGKPQSR